MTGGETFALSELEEVVELVSLKADPDVQIISGAVIKEHMGDRLQVTVIATGFQTNTIVMDNRSVDANLNKDVVGLEEWKSFTTRSTRNRADYLAHRNYKDEDLDVPTIMRFPDKSEKLAEVKSL